MVKKNQMMAKNPHEAALDYLERLAAFAEHNPNPIFEMNLAGKLTYINKSALETFPDLLEKAENHAIFSGLLHLARDLKSKNHKSLIREIEMKPFVYEQQIFFIPKTDLIQIYMADVTKRKEIDHLKNEFISTVSHELRTPLAILKGAILNLKDEILGKLSSKQRGALEIADKNINVLGHLINDLLDLSRLESEKIKLNRSCIDLLRLVQEVVNQFHMSSENKGIELSLDFNQNDYFVYADEGMVLQVFNNLVSNALRYARSKITIKVAKENNLDDPLMIKISILDDGPGIPHHKTKELFHKFIQINRPREGEGYKGTGLGLAICKKIIDLHHGTIGVSSVEGEGSEFFFALPKFDEEISFWTSLQAHLQDAKSHDQTLSIMPLIVDNLKTPENHFSHADYFENLKLVIQNHILRESDHIYYYPSKNILVILARTHLEGAFLIGKRIQSLSGKKILGGDHFGPFPNVSFGLAIFPDEGQSEKGLLEKAMKRLAEYKNN